MKAIILAAGMGSRLGKYTEELPKGMLSFCGKPLLQRQVESLRSAGISDISIVRGYQPEKIALAGVRYYENPNYATTNMLASLFAAEDEMNEPFLVCYADILYEPRVVSALIAAECSIGVVADEDYLEYWQARLDDWQSDMESFQIGANGFIAELGTPTRETALAKQRYVGLLKFSEEGLRQLRSEFHRLKDELWDSDARWRNSKNFRNGYMTDMLQQLIDTGSEVTPVVIRRGWMEFDTTEDYEKAVSWVEDGSLSRFIELPS